MTIDEAIKHYGEAAKREEDHINKTFATFGEDRVLFEQEENECKKCVEENKQLVEWLEELKQLREQTSWIPIAKRDPCKDAISRQDVLDLMSMRLSGKELYKAVYEMQPAILTQKMIPTSEHQPRENGNYLALYRTSDGTADLEFMMVDHCDADGGWLHEENRRKSYKKVIAWAPLPKPYEEESEKSE